MPQPHYHRLFTPIKLEFLMALPPSVQDGFLQMLSRDKMARLCPFGHDAAVERARKLLWSGLGIPEQQKSNSLTVGIARERNIPNITKRCDVLD